MSNPFDERVLALAALAQSLQQVRSTAETGQSTGDATQAVLDGVFRIDAESTEDVYGGVARLGPGLRVLREHLSSQGKDEALPRLALAVVRLERRFVREAAMVEAVGRGIAAVAPQAQVKGSNHPEVLEALGVLYAETISHLRPRVMVQGAPHYLGQPGVVAEIRALLLAAMRSAVLWRQLGGSQWDFLFSRRAMLEAIERRLA
ncbi:high frequency lysogenization protein HflD [Luteimonas sp. SJ-92]|uniref:High frequency lysogenization protein HflD homolog n=1 Tax=Luteimonas salinisoli TaxID=2752307 RepID=A0A853JH77_9GAMM|nr:high frequency lysogenization protein HflD [Luteimonas salinisoli]NZA27929.1 high frequency lysogenization protein HflD [Luteimonas salinisoli]